jgi:hypothetical protein
MDNVRKGGYKGNGKGNEKGNYSANNVEEADNPTDNLEKLEASGGWRALCSLEHRSDHQPNLNNRNVHQPNLNNRNVHQPNLNNRNVHQPNLQRSKNRFAALQVNDEDEEFTGSPPGLTLGDFWPKVDIVDKKGQKPITIDSLTKQNICDDKGSITIDSLTKREPKRKANKKVARYPLCSLELNTMRHEEGPNDLWITVDSGASENVISEKVAPQVKVQPSQGSREGVRYVTATGETMPNKGEKHLQVKTSEGHKCMLNMQVTDVKKPLMSVARICDAGHEVLFRSNGGTITHLGTGQTTKFQRIDNVYRLKVGIVNEPVFNRPGK